MKRTIMRRPLLNGTASLASYLLLAVIGYWPVLANAQFLSDDFDILGHINRGEGMWNHLGAPFYRPAVNTALSAMWQFFGNQPLAFHLLNLLLLALTGLLLQLVWLRSKGPRDHGDSAIGWLVGAVFVLWPSHVEAVSWISGITDSLSAFWCALALYCWLSAWVGSSRKAKAAWAALAGVSLWLAMISKEAALPWALVLAVMPAIVFPWNKHARAEWGKRGAEAAVFCAIGAAYVCWRAHVLGTLIGGYGIKAHFHFRLYDLIDKFQVNMANEFFPFDHWFALSHGTELTKFIGSTLMVGAAVLLFRSSRSYSDSLLPVAGQMAGGRRIAIQHIAGWLRRWGPALFVAMELLLSLNWFAMPGKMPTNEWRLNSAEAILVISALYLCWKRAPNASDLLDTLRGPIFWAASFLTFILLFEGWEDNAILLFAYLWTAFETRPRRERTEGETRLARLGACSFGAAILTILPAINLPVNFNGESGRFSYGPSFFAVLALCCACYTSLKRSVQATRLAWRNLAFATPLLVLTALGVCLYWNNGPWAVSEQTVSKFVDIVRSLHGTSKIYLLATPDTVNGAYCMRVGTESIPEVVSADSDRKAGFVPTAMRAALSEKNFVPGDRLIASVSGLAERAITLGNISNDSRFFVPALQLDPDFDANWFSVRGGRITCKGFKDSRDRIYLINPGEVLDLSGPSDRLRR